MHVQTLTSGFTVFPCLCSLGRDER